jgi:hypothetical protein
LFFFPGGTPGGRAGAAAWQSTHRLGGFAAVESAEGVGTAVHLYFRRAVETGESAEALITDDFLKAAE